MNIIFGINDDTTKPYIDEIKRCFRFGLISSSVIFNTIIEEISPTVNTQNTINIIVFKAGGANS